MGRRVRSSTATFAIGSTRESAQSRKHSMPAFSSQQLHRARHSRASKKKKLESRETGSHRPSLGRKIFDPSKFLRVFPAPDSSRHSDKSRGGGCGRGSSLRVDARKRRSRASLLHNPPPPLDGRDPIQHVSASRISARHASRLSRGVVPARARSTTRRRLVNRIRRQSQWLPSPCRRPRSPRA